MTHPTHMPASSGPIICVGEALIDLFAPPITETITLDPLAARIGGAPANMSIAISRLGGSAAFLGCLADDLPGRWIRSRLSAEGVDLSMVRATTDGQTRLALVTGPPDDRDFTFYGDPAADSLLSEDDLDPERIAAAPAVIVSSLGLTTEPSRTALYRLLEICRDRAVPVVFDPNPRRKTWPDPDEAFRLMRPIIEQAAVLKMGEHEPAMLGTDAEGLRAIQPAGAYLVLTQGPIGCRYWYGDGGPASVAPFAVEAVDSTGAGDAFTAALTFRFAASGYRLSLPDLEFASAVGALTTRSEGAMDALPHPAAVESLLAAAGRGS